MVSFIIAAGVDSSIRSWLENVAFSQQQWVYFLPTIRLCEIVRVVVNLRRHDRYNRSLGTAKTNYPTHTSKKSYVFSGWIVFSQG
jgi:hypothetical protein